MSELRDAGHLRGAWWSLLAAGLLVAAVTALLSLSFANVCVDTSTATTATSDCHAAGVRLSIGPAGWVAFAVAAATVIVASWRLAATRR